MNTGADESVDVDESDLEEISEGVSIVPRRFRGRSAAMIELGEDWTALIDDSGEIDGVTVRELEALVGEVEPSLAAPALAGGAI